MKLRSIYLCTTTIILLIVFFITACDKNDVSSPVTIHDRVLVNNLNFPWEILWGPDNMIWMTEREGKISRVNPSTGEVIPLFTVPDVKTYTDFNGLLGMVLHPQFSSNPYVYVTYNYEDASLNYLEKVVRFTYNGTTLTSPMILVDHIIGKKDGDFIHNGSRLVISSDMKLFITTGDANIPTAPGDVNSLNGKILRINLDGTIPADNPYGNAVWSIGQRNPQGLVFVNGTLFSSMHGKDMDDEINIIDKGRHYGWPQVEGLCNTSEEQTFCSANNVKEPIFTWTPTIAPSGMDYYNNDNIPQWKNSLLLAVLKDKKLLQLKLNDGRTSIESTQEFYKNQYGRMRDIAISPDGKVYISTDNGNHSDVIIELTRQ